MKTRIAFLFCLMLLQIGYSQITVNSIKNDNYGTPQQRATQITEEMTKGLQLTAEQRAKVLPINVKYAEQTEREVVQTKLSAWAKYRKITSIQETKDRELKPILTTEQFRKYQKRRDALMWEGVKTMLW